MRIPEIRDRLYELAIELNCPELKLLADETRRRPMVRRRARARFPRMTPAQVEEINTFAFANPDMGVELIARHFGTTCGRISEALRGLRE